MVKEAIATGSSVDEAREAAVALLNAGSDEEVKYEVIDLPQKKTLGLFGGCPAKVRAYVEIDDEPVSKPTKNDDSEQHRKSDSVRAPQHEKSVSNNQKTDKSSTRANTALDDKKVSNVESDDVKTVDVFEKKPITDPDKLKSADRAVAYLEKILKLMEIDASISTSDYDGGIEITLEGENIGAVVGRRGETLDALQYLTVLAANSNEGSYQRVLLNTGDYRNKRQKALQSLAKKIASQALKNGKNIALEPMNPYERRIIHMTIHDMTGISSWSIGNEPFRRVVIGTSKEGRITYNSRRDNGSDRRGGYQRRPSGGGSGRPYQQRRPSSEASSAVVSDREQKKDMGTAPLYGRIDKKD